MKRAVIITSYLDYPLDIPSLIRPTDHILCLDGGYDLAQSQGIRPDAILGDFDSLQGTLPENDDIPIHAFPPEKDFSDLELALLMLDPKEYPDILIVGGLGGRLDHTLANVGLLEEYSAKPESEGGTASEESPRFEHIEMIDGRNRCFPVHGGMPPVRVSARGDLLPAGEKSHQSTQINDPAATRPKKRYLSLLPLTRKCEGVCLQGVRYPLESAALFRGASLSVSNEFAGDEAVLSFQKGSLLLVVTEEP